ncbi:MAG: hypothetical protein M4579_003794 [Chaenotheca gracillima]|nr:MAG: hypothetical protein M4579_003794 [Chaenotheca gracillima]
MSTTTSSDVEKPAAETLVGNLTAASSPSKEKEAERSEALRAFSSSFVDSEEMVAELVSNLADLPTTPPSLYVDIEGVFLSRHGSVSIIQLLVLPKRHIYLIDILKLQHKAFTTADVKGQTLKLILESASIPKVFFDVRNDSDALYSHYQINLAGIQDIQLLEIASRGYNRRHIFGLSKCIDKDLPLTSDEKQTWKDVKEVGVKLFAPERGGSFEVFNVRPLSKKIEAYCVQDVQFMPKLWDHYTLRMGKVSPTWVKKVEVATVARVRESQQPGFNGKGQHMALAPRW